MIGFLTIFFLNMAMAVTLESQCQKLLINEFGLVLEAIRNEDCLESKLVGKGFKKPGFYLESNEANKYFIIQRKMEEASFCSIPSDFISTVNLKLDKKSDVWNSLQHFSQIIAMTTQLEILKLNPRETKIPGPKICYPYPSFKKAKKFEKNLLPKSLAQLQKGGYLVLSSRLNSIFFMNEKMNSIEYVMNFPIDVIIKDASVEANGDLLILSTTKSYNGKISQTCYEKWDISTSTMMANSCSLDTYEEQILLSINKQVMHVFIKQDTLNLERFEKGQFKLVHTLKGVRNFNLSNAAFLVDQKKNRETK